MRKTEHHTIEGNRKTKNSIKRLFFCLLAISGVLFWSSQCAQAVKAISRAEVEVERRLSDERPEILYAMDAPISPSRYDDRGLGVLARLLSADVCNQANPNRRRAVVK